MHERVMATCMINWKTGYGTVVGSVGSYCDSVGLTMTVWVLL